MIQFESVSKAFDGRPAIEELDLHIAEGEFCVLLGSSGSGKTTTLRMINRLIEYDGGRILFAGEEIRTFAPEMLRRRMGYAIQSTGLFPHWTVEDNIAAVPRLLEWPESRVRARVRELLDLFGLEAETIARRHPHALSGGQQQRVGVARALAADPAILLMDEPFGALDPLTRAGLRTEMARIHRVSGKTIVFVTHDVEEALELATRIVLLDKGRVVQQGTPLKVLTHPANDFVRDFFGGDEIGLHRLALEPVSARQRRTDGGGEGAPGGSIAGSTDLRRALAGLLMSGRHEAPVVDDAGNLTGVIGLDDLVGRDG